METRFKNVFNDLYNSIIQLEKEISNDLITFEAQNKFTPNYIETEEKKDFHYKMITSKMRLIKKELTTLQYHHRQLRKLNGEEVVIKFRPHKSNRRMNESSIADLEKWEQIMDTNNWDNNKFCIKPRHGSLSRKEKKVISSTIDALLEVPTLGSKQLEMYKSAECIVEDTKPRIVGAVMKKTD